MVGFKKGHKTSEETRRKIGESHKGMHHTEESKKKMRKAQKRRFSNPDEIRKLSEAHKGQIPWITGKKHTPESILKMSKSHTKQMANTEIRKRLRETTKKLWTNPEFRKRQVEARKGQHSSPKTEFKKGQTTWNKGKSLTEEEKKHVSESTKKGMANPETIEKLRQNTLRMYESGKFPLQENTKPERQIKEELLKRGYKSGIDFIHQYKFMNKFMCDFCFPEQKVVVEVYGDFWHANPKRYEGKNLHPHQIKDIGRDKSKEAYITTVDHHSWTYLVIWEFDIKKDVSKCVDVIEKALKKAKK